MATHKTTINSDSMPPSCATTDRNTQDPHKKGPWRVVQQGNGLVNLEKTPPWMVPIAERNAKDSPLLRLPGEVRNMIFQYAMTGYVAAVFALDYEDVLNGWPEVVFESRAFGPRVYDNTYHRPIVPSAFHLPEVCRQIYTETATLGYSGCIFQIEEGTLMIRMCMQSWSGSLLPAQRDAVTDIALEGTSMTSLLCGEYPGASFRESLPSLERVHLWDCDLHELWYMCGVYHSEDPPEDVLTLADFKRWIQDMVRWTEGDGVEVVFYPALPSTKV